MMIVAGGKGDPGFRGGVVGLNDKKPSIHMVVAVITRTTTTPIYTGPEKSEPKASQTAYTTNGAPRPKSKERKSCTTSANDGGTFVQSRRNSPTGLLRPPACGFATYRKGSISRLDFAHSSATSAICQRSCTV